MSGTRARCGRFLFFGEAGRRVVPAGPWSVDRWEVGRHQSRHEEEMPPRDEFLRPR